MRYIDRSKLRKPTGWNKKANLAKNAVENGADPNDHSNVWRLLKDGLAELLHDKCWYCESPVDRADNAVDHFRPKNCVSDATNAHNGYRWLAFDESNFRYACTFCNSRRKDLEGGTVGGKADRFPLINEVHRLYAIGPLVQELPLLLDPCEISDWRLLGCHQENGQPCAASLEPTEKVRAEKSIEIYHLNYEPTCNRRHAIAVQLMSDVDEGKRLFELVTHDASRIPDFKAVAARLCRAISRESPYSGDMHFLLRGQRSDAHRWIQDILEA
jgi:5-methylcytosine-specific restriction endonuclease McrA